MSIAEDLGDIAEKLSGYATRTAQLEHELQMVKGERDCIVERLEGAANALCLDRRGLSSCALAWNVRGRCEALNAGFVPENVNWPRFEDGEPVRFGDELDDEPITCFQLEENGSYALFGGDDRRLAYGVAGQRVKRPAVEAADNWGAIANACTAPAEEYAAEVLGMDDAEHDCAEIEEAVRRDLVRRARELAEKEAGE